MNQWKHFLGIGVIIFTAIVLVTLSAKSTNRKMSQECMEYAAELVGIHRCLNDPDCVDGYSRRRLIEERHRYYSRTEMFCPRKEND